jgi:Uma2 family endonuclease
MVATRTTVAEFEATCGDDRVELVDGVVVKMPMGALESAGVSATVAVLLAMHVRPRNLGRVYIANAGFVIFRDRETVLAPDAAFVRAGREPRGEARWHFARLAPDLVVEVLSPFDHARGVRAKVAMYQEAGVPLVWLVDPEAQSVTVLALEQEPVTLTAADTLNGGEVLPDLRIEVAEIFA